MRNTLTFLALLALIGCTYGTYRLPYADGVQVTVASNHNTHTTPQADMYDIIANSPNQPLVAAAAGWVRWIKDSGNSTASTNNYVWIEHPEPFCQNPNDTARNDWPGKPADYENTCKLCPRGANYCNEWTLYAHMAQDSVQGNAGLSRHDWVEQGQFIGTESDVGFTPGGRHLHWAVFQAPTTLTPDTNGAYEAFAIANGRPERIPLVCTTTGRRILQTNGVYIGDPCP